MLSDVLPSRLDNFVDSLHARLKRIRKAMMFNGHQIITLIIKERNDPFQNASRAEIRRETLFDSLGLSIILAFFAKGAMTDHGKAFVMSGIHMEGNDAAVREAPSEHAEEEFRLRHGARSVDHVVMIVMAQEMLLHGPINQIVINQDAACSMLSLMLAAPVTRHECIHIVESSENFSEAIALARTRRSNNDAAHGNRSGSFRRKKGWLSRCFHLQELNVEF